MLRWLSRQGADHPRWNIFFGVAFAGISAAPPYGDRWWWPHVAMIALGALSVLIGVLGLFARRV